MAIPRGLKKCPKCGEYRGQVKASDLNWDIPPVDQDPDRIIKVTCLCDGIPCPNCKKNKIHKPISNSYDEELNIIEHWPYFTGLTHCEVCKKEEILQESDKQMTDEFIRVNESIESIKIEVCKISWDGPHTPVLKWVVGAKLGELATKSDIDRAIKKILNNKRYFKVCTECGERNPVGWMHDDSICQSCAECNYGVVY